MILSVGLSVLGVGIAGADHGEAYSDEDIIEVQTVTTENVPDGHIEVELSYHLGDEVQGFEVTILEHEFELLSTSGFSQTAEREFEWDEQTNQPSVTVQLDGDRSVTDRTGLDYTRTEDWTLAGTLRTHVSWLAINPDQIERTGFIASPEPDSIAGREMLYIGEYEQTSFQSVDEEFTIISSDHADTSLTTQDIEELLITSSNLFDGGGTAEPVTGFIVTDPIRLGGLASGATADFWIHEESVQPAQTTLLHEYLHTRQVDDRADSSEWTHEAEATYYENLLALKQGFIDYHQFYDQLDVDASEYSEVILSDPTTWEDTRADYELGSITLANLDTELRTASNGDTTYEDIFREKNAHDGEITDQELAAIAASEASWESEPFFDSRIRSQPEYITVPPPTVYETPIDGASLDVSLEDASLSPGDEDAIRIEVTNTGADPSLAPTLQMALPDEVNPTVIDIAAGSGIYSEVTEVDDLLVFDTIPPGETLVIDYGIAVPETEALNTHTAESTFTDLGGEIVSNSALIDITITPDVVLQLDDGYPVTESVEFDASDSTDEAGIEAYHWEIRGPEDSTIESADPIIEESFDTPGEYTVTLTVENANGATATTEQSFVMSDEPSVEIDAPDDIQPGEPAVFNSSVTNEFGEYTVHWEIGGEGILADRLEFTFSEGGEREVSVTVVDDYGAVGMETISVLVGDDGNGESETGDDGYSIDDAFGPGFGIVSGISALLLLLFVRRFLFVERYRFNF